MNVNPTQLKEFNRLAAMDSVLLESFPLGAYHIMPRVVHLSTSRGNRNVRKHCHHVWEFNLILQGRMNFYWDEQSTLLGPGDVFFMPPDHTHGWRMLSEDFLILGLQSSISILSGSNIRLKRDLIAAMKSTAYHLSGGPTLVSNVAALVETMLTPNTAFRREKCHLRLRALYLDMFSRFFPAGSKAGEDEEENDEFISLSGRKIAETLEYYVSDNIGKMIRVADICQRFRLSECQLNRLCRRETGMTVSHYIAYQKNSMARHLLIHSERMIKEIAVLTGYTDVNYFCRRFKMITGMTPEEFRSRHGLR